MVGDGDSKAHTRLLQIQPYGAEEVQKEECINHVGKRLDAALSNLVANCSKKSVTLGGQGHGRLTHEAIRKLQIYYSQAIRSANSAEEMRRNLLASIHHGYSTYDLPQHQYCPPGPNSWCFFKRPGHSKKSLGFREQEHGQRLGQARLKKRLFKSTLEEQQKVTVAAREKARQEKEAEESGPAYQANMF
ncbi:hypothetical protein RRG08_004843 [Elysia crispata]|uniref:Mutator-like transposase domain-containing protein n=1 Tax=Elysia crispata TaxID=231223 RepID=A0AAE1DQJ0_9GAST|nr:hypothetical protein RRG08_004843 [Elysia crispata]